MTYHGVMFHHFHGGRHPASQGSVSAEELEDLILYLRKHYRLFCAWDWQTRFLQGKLQSRDICLTFDDSLKCQYDVALPVLRHYGITAFWFVYTSPLEGKTGRLELYRYFRSTRFKNMDEFYRAFMREIRRSDYAAEVSKALAHFDPSAYLREYPMYSDRDRIFRFLRDRVLGSGRYQAVMDAMIRKCSLKPDNVRDLLWMNRSDLGRLHREGHVLGLHSHTHPTDLGSLDYGEQEKEYRRNHEWLRKITGSEPQSMSHPCNSFNADTFHILAALNIRFGFIAHMTPRVRSPYEIPRENHVQVLNRMKTS